MLGTTLENAATIHRIPPMETTMQWKFFLAALAILCILSIVKLASKARPRSSSVLRYKRLDLFNSTEHAFLLALRASAPPHIAVLAKVRVGDLVTPHKHDISAFNRINRKHVDFVLYNTQNRSVLRAIELDGPTHSSPRAVKSDNIKNLCFASARLPLSRVPVSHWNDPETLRALFAHDAERTIDFVPPVHPARSKGRR